MGGVDTSKWKPRQLRGTPAYKFRTKLSLGVLAGAAAIAFIYVNLPFARRFRNETKEKYFTLTEEEIDRKYLFRNSFIPQLSSRGIKEIQENEKQFTSER